MQQNGNEQQSQRYERRKRQKGKEEEEGEEGEEGEEEKKEKRGGREGEEEEEDEERRGRRNDDDDDDDDDAKCQNRWRFRLGEERCPIPKEVLHSLLNLSFVYPRKMSRNGAILWRLPSKMITRKIILRRSLLSKRLGFPRKF